MVLYNQTFCRKKISPKANPKTKPVKTSLRLCRFKKTLDQATEIIKINKKGSSLSNFSAINVPQDHYLVLGDNRDESADSRLIGFIPRNEIVGKTNSVFFSLNPKKYFLPRTERFFYSFQQ